MAGAVGLGIAGVVQVGLALVPFLVVGPVLVVAYNPELFGGAIHNDVGFAAAWGAFPVLTAYVAQTGTLALAPAGRRRGRLRPVRRAAGPQHPGPDAAPAGRSGDGHRHPADGTTLTVSRALLLAPLERALRALSWGVVLTAAALAVARLD